MRLLTSDTLEFATFNDENLPEYLILSHTWGDKEVSYQDMRYLQKLKTLPDALQQDTAVLFSLGLFTGTSSNSREDIENKSGYRKVASAARTAALRKYKYFWIDTCCIDKTSSSELQEAINSMYRWYQEAAICIALLENTSPIRYTELGEIQFGRLVSETRWIKRGWTLQELIAPREVHFVNADWRFLTSKSISSESLSSVTGIPAYVLRTGDLSQSSVAQKMSWAADRSTTRIEDRAYSLLGIFGVHMPMLYGEGAHAFIRLQEEILRVTPDDSILYWKDADDSIATCRGLLAPSPGAFKACADVRAGPSVLISNTNLGISLTLKARSLRDKKDPVFVGLLNASIHGSLCTVTLRTVRFDGYNPHFQSFSNVRHCARVQTDLVDSVEYNNTEQYTPKTVYVSHNPQIQPNAFIADPFCFRFRFLHRPNRLKIGRTWPPTTEDEDGRMIIVPPTKQLFIFVGKILLQYKNGPGTEICKMLAGLDRDRSRVWCRLVKDDTEWPAIARPDSRDWRTYIEKVYGSSQNHGRATSLALLDQNAVPALAVPLKWVSVKVEAGISSNKVCYFVEISEKPHDFVYE